MVIIELNDVTLLRPVATAGTDGTVGFALKVHDDCGNDVKIRFVCDAANAADAAYLNDIRLAILAVPCRMDRRDRSSS